MADEMTIKIEQEEWQQDDNEPCSEPLYTEMDGLIEEFKTEPGSPHKTVDDIKFAECWIESEGVDETAGFFSCRLCEAGFTNLIQRNRHERLFCRRRFFDNPLKTGPKSTPAAFELGANLNEPEPEGTKRFKCVKCKYSTNHSRDFNNHVKRHPVVRKFACTQCEYKATTKTNLANHLRTHSDVKPHACTVCNYRTVRKSYLTIHMLVHMENKLFKCTQCDYACNARKDLVSHINFKHTKERPYFCTQCEYTSVTISNLSRHKLTHTGEKKLSCSKCTYKCNRSAHLKIHVMSKHGS